ncbi:PQQ-binding-like beta-propeller repeat protein [Chloroflexota bacterium]
MESGSGDERWVICPVCHKGNPAGTKFCQHCWGAIIRVENTITTEELQKVTKKRENYLKRKKIIKIASASLFSVSFLVGIIVFLCYFSDVIIKPDSEISSDASSGQWSMFRRDLSHAGSVEATAIVPKGVQKWVFPTGAAVRSSPAVIDGTVYFGSQDSNLYAVDAETGEENWVYETGSWVDSSPSVVDNVVYFGSNDSRLYALDTDNGEEVWTFKTSYPVKASPAITEEIVYIRSDDYYLYALDIEDGKEIWRFNTKSPVGSSTAVSDGIVFTGSGDGYCYALNAANGQRRLRFKTHYSVTSTPAVKDGNVYLAHDNGYLYVIDGSARTWLQEHEIHPFWVQMWVMDLPGVPKPPPQSGLLWGVKLGRSSTASSPLITDDTVYIGSDKYLFAVDIETHSVRWKFETGGAVRSSPVMTGSAVVVGSEDGMVYAVDAATGEKLWDFATGDKITSSPAVADGVIYIGSYDGNMYAIE